MTTSTIPEINAETREQLGTRYTKRLRKAGKLPGVIYGHKQDPIHVVFNQRELVDMLHGHAHLISVQMAGQSESCLVKEVQWDFLGKEILHIDLARVNLEETVTVEVDLQIVGDAVGLKKPGAFLDHPLATLEIECKATDIPDAIKVDVSEVDEDQSITVADLNLPQGVVCTLDPETIVAQLLIQDEADEDAQPAEPTDAEPQVISQKKTEEDAE